MKHLVPIGEFEVEKRQQIRWRAGSLAREWARAFPQLFDEDDVRLAGTQGRFGKHFIEWLAAIILYHTTGYLSLVCKYEFANHRRKRDLVERVLPGEVLALLRDRAEFGRAQAPDLFVYAPDESDWFFCEVKGPKDRMRPEQMRKFEALSRLTGKPVRTMEFKWAKVAPAAAG